MAEKEGFEGRSYSNARLVSPKSFPTVFPIKL